MKLNCKLGDLAVIVRSDSGNEGAVVVCLEMYVGQWANGNYEAGWLVDRWLPCRSGGQTRHVADRKLRPLRDGDGEDEMLRIAGRPADVQQAA